MAVSQWDWSRSNGSASAQLTLLAYTALTSHGATTNFSKEVWNDIVNKIKALDDEWLLSWNNEYGTYQETLMTDNDKVMTARRFNAVVSNTPNIFKWEWEPVLGRILLVWGDICYGSYFINATNIINTWAGANKVEARGASGSSSYAWGDIEPGIITSSIVSDKILDYSLLDILMREELWGGTKDIGAAVGVAEVGAYLSVSDVAHYNHTFGLLVPSKYLHSDEVLFDENIADAVTGVITVIDDTSYNNNFAKLDQHLRITLSGKTKDSNLMQGVMKPGAYLITESEQYDEEDAFLSPGAYLFTQEDIVDEQEAFTQVGKYIKGATWDKNDVFGKMWPGKYLYTDIELFSSEEGALESGKYIISNVDLADEQEPFVQIGTYMSGCLVGTNNNISILEKLIRKDLIANDDLYIESQAQLGSLLIVSIIDIDHFDEEEAQLDVIYRTGMYGKSENITEMYGHLEIENRI